MRERGIHFNSEMVRAVMEGRKVQTRRAVKFPLRDKDLGCELSGNELAGEVSGGNYRNCPFGAVGDRLWVRENFYQHGRIHQPYFGEATDPEDAYFLGDKRVLYPADGVALPPQRQRDDFWRSKPSIHMPRWASRITLEITGIRVERLNSITEQDAAAEGVGSSIWFAAKGVPEEEWSSLGERGAERLSHINNFATLWESIYGEESWQANPWVWVIEFKRVEGE